MRRAALALVACEMLLNARVLVFAAAFRWLPAELRDGQAALRAVMAALEEDGHPA